ncbi:MAG: 50S ribosome-binding GTPase [Armatimonadetes bacterium]|nr:50S ribosome-binding GTPase [Armatimonadota bacterium]
MAIGKSGCDTCPIGAARVERLGVNVGDFDYVVALAGNPNTGKSTVFNSLTGLKQHTGNWPGKTIARAEGGFVYRDKRYKLVDLPGTYSLLSATPDEEVARDFILFGKPAVTIVVADATRLERNLNLMLQVLHISDRAVLCVNLLDEARAHGVEVDIKGLSRELGIPVVGAAARQGIGIPELLAALADVAEGTFICRPHRPRYRIPGLDGAVAQLSEHLEAAYPGVPHKDWIAMRLLEGDQEIAEAVRNGQLGQLKEDHKAKVEADHE